MERAKIIHDGSLSCGNSYTSLEMHYLDVNDQRCGILNVISYDYKRAAEEVDAWTWIGGSGKYLNPFSQYLFDRNCSRPRLPNRISELLIKDMGKIGVVEILSLRRDFRENLDLADLLLCLRILSEQYDAFLYPDWENAFNFSGKTRLEKLSFFHTQGFQYLDDYALCRVTGSASANPRTGGALGAGRKDSFKRSQARLRSLRKSSPVVVPLFRS